MDDRTNEDRLSDFLETNDVRSRFNPLFSTSDFVQGGGSTFPELESEPEHQPPHDSESKNIPDIIGLSKIEKSIKGIHKRFDDISNETVINNFVENKIYEDQITHTTNHPDQNIYNRQYSPTTKREYMNRSLNLFVDKSISLPEQIQPTAMSTQEIPVDGKHFNYEGETHIENNSPATFVTNNENTSIPSNEVSNYRETENSFSNNSNSFFKINNLTEDSKSTKVINNTLKSFDNKNSKSFNSQNEFSSKLSTTNEYQLNPSSSTTNEYQLNPISTEYQQFESLINNYSMNSPVDVLNSSPVNTSSNETFIRNVIKNSEQESIIPEIEKEYTFLAKGGYVDSPTKAIVGEAGPEIVTPLEQVPKILAEAHTIEKANENVSKNATTTAAENQNMRMEQTNQPQPQEPIPLPIPSSGGAENPALPSAPPSGGGLGAPSRINESIKEIHSIPKWRQMLG